MSGENSEKNPNGPAIDGWTINPMVDKMTVRSVIIRS